MFVSFTPELEIVAFTTSSQLFIRAQFEGCDTNDDPKCFNIVVSIHILINKYDTLIVSPNLSFFVGVFYPEIIIL